MPRNYQPKGLRNSRDRYFCRCGNNVFSTLPKSTVEQTEVISCTRCQTPILFSTVALPKKIGYPISRRQWGGYTEFTYR